MNDGTLMEIIDRSMCCRKNACICKMQPSRFAMESSFERACANIFGRQLWSEMKWNAVVVNVARTRESMPRMLKRWSARIIAEFVRRSGGFLHCCRNTSIAGSGSQIGPKTFSKIDGRDNWRKWAHHIDKQWVKAKTPCHAGRICRDKVTLS